MITMNPLVVYDTCVVPTLAEVASQLLLPEPVSSTPHVLLH